MSIKSLRQFKMNSLGIDHLRFGGVYKKILSSIIRVWLGMTKNASRALLTRKPDFNGRTLVYIHHKAQRKVSWQFEVVW